MSGAYNKLVSGQYQLPKFDKTTRLYTIKIRTVETFMKTKVTVCTLLKYVSSKVPYGSISIYVYINVFNVQFEQITSK